MRYRNQGGVMTPIRSLDDTTDQEVHIHMMPPEDEEEEETMVTDEALQRLVDRMGPRVRRRRISDEEEAYSEIADLRFPREPGRRASSDAAQASSAIREQERHIDRWQKKN